MGDVLEYGEILQEVRGAMHPGRLKLTSTNVIFKNKKTGRVDQYTSEDVDTAQWLLRARGYCLKLKLYSGTVHRYDGFRDTEFDKMSNFVKKNFNTPLEKREISVKGWNWGETLFDGNCCEFKINDKYGFEVPLGNASHCVNGKNEVTIEFHPNDDAAVSLCEMRFHIPADKDKDNTEEQEDPAEEFCKKVLEKADIVQVSGDAVAIFSEVYCLTPRGRYDIKLYPSFLQLHGKTFDYKIPYTTILRLFLLPHRDGRQMFFVISLDPPIKQGQTRYHFLILLFNKEDETTLELTLSEEEIQEKYEGKLAKEMQGLEYEIISRLMKTLVNRKITVPGSFQGKHGLNCVSCSYKAATGFLYPLERGFIFVHKPPMHIRFDEVATVNFARSSGNTRSFDFEVDTKNGNSYTFVGIDKDEYTPLYDFVKTKKIRVQNLGKKGDQTGYDDMLDSDEGDDHDAYLERVKKEGKERNEAVDSDEDESTDEDYNLPDEYSEVDEEFDTDAGSDSSDSESASQASDGGESGSEAERRRAERKEKKEKKKRKKTITIKEPALGEDGEVKEKKQKKKSGDGPSRKRKKEKAPKDPNRPKRPLTAYIIWFNGAREELKKKYPDDSMTDLSKHAGEKWRSMSESDKKEYEEENIKLKEKYEEAMVEYKQNLEDNPLPEVEGSSEAKKVKKSKPPKSPAKGVTDTKAGSGGAFKSKEFISDSDSAAAEDSDDRPLKRKEKPKKKKKEVKKEEASDADSESEEEKKKPRKKRGEKRGSDDSASDAELPSDYEEKILSSPEHSPPGSPAGSADESVSSASGGDDSGSESGLATLALPV